MTETGYSRPSQRTRLRLRAFSGIFCLCSILILGACGIQLPFINKQSSNTIDHDSEHMKTVSHMEPTRLEPVERPSYKNLFGKSLRSDSERLDRMERAVQNMRNDFDNVAPSIRRLMAIEGDMQNLIIELRKMTTDTSRINQSPSTTVGNSSNTIGTRQQVSPATQQVIQDKTPTPQAVPMAKKVKKPAAIPTPMVKTAPPPPPVQNGKPSVYGLRIGEHPGKTRIVLDVNAKTSFKPDIDNSEKIMIVELPEASWGTATAKNFGRSPFITSYKVEKSGDGSLLIFRLKKGAKISYKGDLPSISGSGRRLVIDLTAG